MSLLIPCLREQSICLKAGTDKLEHNATVVINDHPGLFQDYIQPGFQKGGRCDVGLYHDQWTIRPGQSNVGHVPYRFIAATYCEQLRCDLLFEQWQTWSCRTSQLTPQSCKLRNAPVNSLDIQSYRCERAMYCVLVGFDCHLHLLLPTSIQKSVSHKGSSSWVSWL